MKSRILLFSMLLMVPVLALSQSIKSPDFTNSEIILNTTYVNSTTDTTGAFYPGPWNIVTLRATTLDSASIAYIIHKRARGETTWVVVTAAVGDTLTVIGGAGAAKAGHEIVLRNAATDRIGGAGTQFRVLAKSLASGNGVTTPSYVLRVEYAK